MRDFLNPKATSTRRNFLINSIKLAGASLFLTKGGPIGCAGIPPRYGDSSLENTPYAETFRYLKEGNKEVTVYPDSRHDVTTIYMEHHDIRIKKEPFGTEPYKYKVLISQPDSQGWVAASIRTSTRRMGCDDIIPLDVEFVLKTEGNKTKWRFVDAWVPDYDEYYYHKFTMGSADVGMAQRQIIEAHKMAEKAFQAYETAAQNSRFHKGKFYSHKSPDSSRYVTARIADIGDRPKIHIGMRIKHPAFDNGEASFLYKFYPNEISLKNAAGLMQTEYFNSHAIFKTMSLQDRQIVSEAMAAAVYMDAQKLTSEHHQKLDGENFYLYDYRQITDLDRPWLNKKNPEASIEAHLKRVLDGTAMRAKNAIEQKRKKTQKTPQKKLPTRNQQLQKQPSTPSALTV